MIYVVGDNAYKSESDRSLNSFNSNLKARVEKSTSDVNELTSVVLNNITYLGSLSTKIEAERKELIDLLHSEENYFRSKDIYNTWSNTFETVRRVLEDEGNNISNFTEDIGNAINCLSKCQTEQSCFSNYSTCISTDSEMPCQGCYSTQGGCTFCDSQQSVPPACDTCFDTEYNRPCTRCFGEAYQACSTEQLSCTSCHGNNSCNRCYTTTYNSCNNCQMTVGTCDNCYSGTYGQCGAGQVSTCGERHSACTSHNEVYCSGCDSCQSNDKDNETCVIFNNLKCKEGYHSTNNTPDTCALQFTSSNGGITCQKGYSIDDNGGIHCESGYGDGTVTCNSNHDALGGSSNCGTSYSCPNGQGCLSEYSQSGTTTNCLSEWKDGTNTCERFYVQENGDIGCTLGYNDYCPTCYGTSYGCSGCFDTDYCSKCNTDQTYCNSCVKGEDFCGGCVRGQTIGDDTFCNDCYGSCYSQHSPLDWCTVHYDAETGLISCRACVYCEGCNSCQTSCYGSYSCYQGCGPGDCGSTACGSLQGGCGSSNCSQCGSSNCGSSNCGNTQCGTSQCGWAQCGSNYSYCPGTYGTCPSKYCESGYTTSI